jgi:hypothetical protein
MKIGLDIPEYVKINGHECKKADLDKIKKCTFTFTRQFNEIYFLNTQQELEEEIRIDFVNN